MSKLKMWKILKLIFLLLIFINSRSCFSEDVRGRARLFRDSFTSTVTVSKVVTSVVPSSCVQVEPTLPPCRNVRYLRFPKLPAVTFNHPSNEEVISNWKAEAKIETTPLGWGEYFGFYAPTVTVTTTDLRISTVQDPSVVVTFAVKGCRPLKLPMDLDRCPVELPSTIAIEEALKTSTVVTPSVGGETVLPTRTMPEVSATSTAVFDGLASLPEKQPFDNSNLLEASPQEATENGPVQPTETLTQ